LLSGPWRPDRAISTVTPTRWAIAYREVAGRLVVIF
jgi:hypothetical protein